MIGIDGHQSAALKSIGHVVGLQPASKLVAGDEWLANGERTDAAVLEIVQIASADADRGNFDEHLVAPAIPQAERRYPRITRAVKEQGMVH